ncbi:MAG: hypothetical protein JW936_10460, partial [Sedimentisphaerales bacterium]|nr:hypothetical protein [Sedimentisphaerales bacterium]
GGGEAVPDRGRVPGRTMGASGGQDAALTIVLAEYLPEGWYEAQGLQARAQGVLGSSDVWLEQTDTGVSVRYGHFNRYEEAERAFGVVRNNYAAMDAGGYQFCYIYNIPRPNPPIPRDWDLFENNCGYSLEIATYYNVPEEDYYDRKADAVRAVESLRAEGETAYLVHGNQESRVFVGCFPRDVVQTAYVNGELQQVVNPLVQAFINRYEYRYENGGVVYNVGHDGMGGSTRTPIRPVLVNVDTFWEEGPF